MSRLRAVPAPTKPLIIDPPCPDTLSDEWITGWQACREVLGEEWKAAYERGLHARSLRIPLHLALLAYGAVLLAFIGGFMLAIAAFA